MKACHAVRALGHVWTEQRCRACPGSSCSASPSALAAGPLSVHELCMSRSRDLQSRSGFLSVVVTVAAMRALFLLPEVYSVLPPIHRAIGAGSEQL